MPPSSLMWVCCLCTGTLCLCLASSEESTTDGLTSTSLLEFAMMSHLEAVNSHEQTSPEATEPDLIPGSLHAAPGSGFASEENEESKILQPPQYFWEDGGELNDSSLDLGQATGRLFLPCSSSPLHQGSGEAKGCRDLFSCFDTTLMETRGLSGEAELAEPTVEAGGEEHSAREEFLETTVGWEMLEPTVLTELEQPAETPVWTPSPGGSSIDTQTHSGGEQHPASPATPWDRAEEPMQDPVWNDTEPATEPRAYPVLSAEELHSLCKPSCLYVLSFQVICKDWSNLAGKNYIILNMSDNIDCEEFRLERGPQLLALVEDAFSRQTDGLQDRWLISLSKPNENEKHLLMTLAGEQGVIPTKDVLMALGDVKRSLAEIGIQNYSTTTSCQSHPNQTRSDYGKLFVVLVIIGSICAIIIVLGLIYNCWQRRLPKMKNMVSAGWELRFVENGCHDNPTLDVASDSQSEMQEKKPSVNGGNTINGPDSWDVLINKQASEDVDVFEEDTHL
uniref:Podocalyxin like 2 n=1 Tax=Anas platyrhynchos TaxID=8839 RepID=A0A8B9ZFS4_ANAPL